MSYTNQFVLDIKEIVTVLYRTMTLTGGLFQGLVIAVVPQRIEALYGSRYEITLVTGSIVI